MEEKKSLFDPIKKSMMLLKRAHKELDPKSIREGGEYHKWYVKTKAQTAEEAKRLSVWFLLAPFKLNSAVDTTEFAELIKKENKEIATAVKNYDAEAFENALRSGYAENLKWVIVHSGMLNAPNAIQPFKSVISA